MNINFMAREGGDVLRHVANKNAQNHLPGNGVRLIDVRHDMPDASSALCHTYHEQKKKMPLHLTRSMFSFVTGQRKLGLNRIELFIESDAALPSASQIVELRLGECASACGCEYEEVTCIASAEWPRLFHGVIEFAPRWVTEDSRHEFGD
jgi:hypothetical protein